MKTLKLDISTQSLPMLEIIQKQQVKRPAVFLNSAYFFCKLPFLLDRFYNIVSGQAFYTRLFESDRFYPEISGQAFFILYSEH